MFRLRSLIGLAVVAVVLVFAAVAADARVGGGFSGGSRGFRTYSPPPITRTAPNTAAPVQRSLTGRPSQPFGTPNRPGLFGNGLFGGGLFGGLAAGFLGAGLFGLLFGHGFFGGLGGAGSMLGLLLQIGLIVLLVRFALGWWQRRNAPAFASGSPSSSLHAFDAGASGFGAGTSTGAPLSITKSDYDAFEHLLGEIQRDYGAEDLNALRANVTPEMLSYLAEDLTQNASRGVVNEISEVKLLQGDLAEAWREGSTDYATVAMRFSLIDRMIERASGRVIEGDDRSIEVTEVWTFRREQGGNWLLSAIQQA
ncbi:MAG TPA: TIM44-like domain-containing protein [Pseudolabrys sp.]|nr:TIM44-like domain-containing protein [Pseudolabrys sp.]